MDAQEGHPIEFASLQIKDTDLGTFADAEGNFTFKGLCDAEFDIVVTHIGYKSITHHHDAFHEDSAVIMLAPDHLMLESVVIEAEAMQDGYQSSSLEKLSAKELDAVRNRTFGDALSQITGVSVLKTGNNIVKPIIHGLHSNRVLIINNGIRHESQAWGHDHAPEIDASLAGELTVIKGAAAIEYGPNALGGVVIVNPPSLTLSSHLHGDIGLKAESNGRVLDGDILLQKGFKNFAWQVQGTYRKQGDLSAPNYSLTNTGTKEYGNVLALRYHKSNWDLYAYYSRLSQTPGILRASVTGNLNDLANAIETAKTAIIDDFSYTIKNPRQEVSHDLFRLSGSYNFDRSRLDWKYGYQLNDRKEYDIRRGVNNSRPSINLKLYTHTFDLEWLHPEWKGWEGNIGVQWLYQDNNNIAGTGTIPFIPNYNHTNVGFFVTESKHFRTFSIDWGIRYDYRHGDYRGRDNTNNIYANTLSFGNISSMLGIVKSYDHATLRVNLASAWRPPDVAEMYSFGKRVFTNEYGFYTYEVTDGNIVTERVLSAGELEIKSENGYKLIADYQYHQGTWQVGISPYANYIRNYIYQAPFGIVATVRGPFPGFIYRQSDAVFGGADATVEVRHTNRWTSEVTLSYLYARDAGNGDVLFGIPPGNFSYRVEWTKPLDKIIVTGSAKVAHMLKQNHAPRVISPRAFTDNIDFDPFADDDSIFDFTDAPEAYTLLSATVAVEFKRWVITVSGRNMLNTAYRDYTDLMRYFADAPGISAEIGVRIKF